MNNKISYNYLLFHKKIKLITRVVRIITLRKAMVLSKETQQSIKCHDHVPLIEKDNFYGTERDIREIHILIDKIIITCLTQIFK